MSNDTTIRLGPPRLADLPRAADLPPEGMRLTLDQVNECTRLVAYFVRPGTVLSTKNADRVLDAVYYLVAHIVASEQELIGLRKLKPAEGA